MYVCMYYMISQEVENALVPLLFHENDTSLTLSLHSCGCGEGIKFMQSFYLKYEHADMQIHIHM